MEFYESFYSVPEFQRYANSVKIKNKYRNKIPIIIDRFSKTDPEIKMHKYLLDNQLLFSDLMTLLRKSLSISPYQSLFLFHYKSNTVINMGENINSIYDKYKDRDGFLYIVYSLENTFG
jgi:GABA(A) receptor-associated protein